MENKNADIKRLSTSVPYVRTFDETCKKRSCISSFFKYSISFVTFLFLIALVGFLVMVVLYANLQSAEDRPQEFTSHFPLVSDPVDVVKEKRPFAALFIKISPNKKDAANGEQAADDSQIQPNIIDNFNQWISNKLFNPLDDLGSTNEEQLTLPDVDPIPNIIGKGRAKRQVSANIPDCRGKKEECEIILKSVRGLTKEVRRRLDRINKELEEHGIVNEKDSSNMKFRKIFDCLQCRNAINHKAEEDNSEELDALAPGAARQNQAMSELMPFFETRAYADEEADNQEEQAEFNNGEERSGRVPKAPGQPEVMEYTKNNSKIVDNYKITEIIKNVTIIEKEDGTKIEIGQDGSQTIHQQGSQQGSQQGYQQGLQFGSQQGYQQGSQFGSQQGSQQGYQQGSQFGSHLGYQQGNQQNSQQLTPQQNSQGFYHQQQQNPQQFNPQQIHQQGYQQNSQLIPQLVPQQNSQSGQGLYYQQQNAQQNAQSGQGLHQQQQNAQQGSQQGGQGFQKYTFMHHQPASAGDESHVTSDKSATVPIILPTAETTKSSQQIQFSPQANWPTVPVCFYGTPASPSAPLLVPDPFKGSSNAQFMPFRIPPQGYDPNTPMSMWPFFSQQQQQQPLPQQLPQPQQQPQPQQSQAYQTLAPFQINQQQPQPQQFSNARPQAYQTPAPFQINLPQQATTIPASTFGQGVMMGPDHRSLPYYCAFVPQNYQQQMQNYQQQVPNVQSGQIMQFNPGYQQGFAMKSSGAKNTYDESDEKYFVEECSGFWCSPPYKKCIRNDQRCDGRVDCIGADDEIGCNYEDSSYYSRLASAHGNGYQLQAQNTMVTRYDAPTESPVTESPRETTTLTAIIPPMPELFACKRIVQTIPLIKRCDNSFDCEDASDEEGCTCKDYLRQSQASAICDGHVDCYDGSDERGCGFCNEDQYHCHRSGGCISKKKRCDEKMDCNLNEDELDCFALTDGNLITLDMDIRPHLNLEGVLSRYNDGLWRPSCFKSDFRTGTKRNSAAQKICEYLGFKGVEHAEEAIVKTTKLLEWRSTKDDPTPYEYPPHFVPAKKNDNMTCYGIYIRCKPILNRKLSVHLQSDPKTKAQSYLWPWEASIFVNGKYHCSAVLLEHNLLLSSSLCGDGIDLSKNYTAAVMGMSSPYIKFNSPYQQTSQVVDIRPIKHSDASLLKLKSSINMTRNVQPLYLEKRIFPASEEDTCVALGVNANHERRMIFLQPIVDNCPKCHRCYMEKDHTSTCSTNATSTWSGNVVCLSKNGWYPAAVFHDRDESCGFSSKQILNSIDYLHAHLSEAINEQEQPHEAPACEGIRGSLGECIAWSKVCDGIRDSQDGVDENPEHCQKMKERCENDVLQCKCSKSQLRCNNGQCLPKEKFCDGRTDCADGSDEPETCNCVEYLKLTRPGLVCDGVRNCYDKSDENPERCLCKDSSFKCYGSSVNGTSPCIPEDFVCDGQADCPNGEDEADKTCWSITPTNPSIKSNGEVMRRTYGVLQSICSPEPITRPQDVMEACRRAGFSSGVLVQSNTVAASQYVPRNDFYMFQLNKLTWMMMRDDKSFGIYTKPEGACYRLFVHCF